jgi:hypothetical protein
MAGIQFTNSPQRFPLLFLSFSHRRLCGYHSCCTRKHFQLLFFLLGGGENNISIGVFITGSFISTTQQQWQ